LNYLQELNAFRDWTLLNHPSTGQIALWYSLMSIDNMTGWQEWFTVANQTLQLMSGMSKAGLDKARGELINKGLIQYKTGSTKQAGKYRLVSIYNKKVDQWENNEKTNSRPMGEQTENNEKTINRHKKEETKPKNNPLNPPAEKPVKNIYGEFVMLTDKEYQSLTKKYKDDLPRMIEILDNYLGQSAKNRRRYDSHNHVLHGWVKERLAEEKAKSQPKEKYPDNF